MSRLELCRLCAGRSDGVEIFNPSNSYFGYKISFTLNIEVKEEDDRRTVCKLCQNKVNEFYDFKNMCRNTEAQGIGVPKLLPGTFKIKEEIKEEPAEEHIIELPGGNPVKIIGLPFIIKGDKFVQLPKSSGPDNTDESSAESSVDFLISQVVTDESKSSFSPEAEFPAVDDYEDTPAASSPAASSPAASSPVSPTPVAPTPVVPTPVVPTPVAPTAVDDSSVADNPTVTTRRRRGTKRTISPDVKVQSRVTRTRTGVLQRKTVIDSGDSDPDDPEYEDKGDNENEDEDNDTNEDQDEDNDSDEVMSPKSKPKALIDLKKIVKPDIVEGKCVKCEKQFPSTLALESHQMTEHFSETWYCYDCLCGFPNYRTYKYHKRNFCKKPAVIKICTHCQESFNSYEELKVHSETCKSNRGKAKNESKPVEKATSNKKRTFRCSFCEVETDDNAEFLVHLREHKKNPVSLLKCPLCEKTFKDKGALICHKEFQHKDKQAASASGKRPTDNQSAKEDQVNNSDEPVKPEVPSSRKYNKEYKCTKCDETFPDSGKLICHTVLAHKKK